MVRRGNFVLLGGFVLSGALLAAASSAGCRAETSHSSSSGDGGDPSTSASTGGDGGNSAVASVGAGGSTTGTGGGGGAPPACTGQDASVFQVNNDPNTPNPIGPGIKVALKGVVAMSQKFLVSKSSTSGSCLWGVFVSAPNQGKQVTPYSGTIVLSYGNKATQDQDGNTYCPKLSIDPIGDAIPDDVKPGDVLNVTGKSDYFLLSQCSGEPMGSTVKQRQISNSCLVEKTGETQLVPPAHPLSAAEIAQAADPDDTAFHDMWGGVKLRVDGPVNTVPQMVNGMPSVTNQYGQFYLEGSNLQVGDKLYYRGYLKATNKCHDGPMFTLPHVVDSVEGFHYLDYCTWSLAPNNKCTDLTPASNDCAAGGPGGTPLSCP